MSILRWFSFVELIEKRRLIWANGTGTTTMQRSKRLFASTFFKWTFGAIYNIVCDILYYKKRSIDLRWSEKETSHYGRSTLKKNLFHHFNTFFRLWINAPGLQTKIFSWSSLTNFCQSRQICLDLIDVSSGLCKGNEKYKLSSKNSAVNLRRPLAKTNIPFYSFLLLKI